MIRYKDFVIIEDDYNKPIKMTTKANYDSLIEDANKYITLANFETTNDVLAYIDEYLSK